MPFIAFLIILNNDQVHSSLLQYSEAIELQYITAPDTLEVYISGHILFSFLISILLTPHFYSLIKLQQALWVCESVNLRICRYVLQHSRFLSLIKKNKLKKKISGLKKKKRKKKISRWLRILHLSGNKTFIINSEF